MPRRQRLLLRILGFVFAVFVGLALWSDEWASPNPISLVAFSLLLVVLGFLTLIVHGDLSVDGHRGLPRPFWVVFASFTGAFGLAMLLAILGLPWLGYAGFALLLGEWAWWVIPLLAVGLYPMTNSRLR
jgi:hypothetical protein